MDERIFERLTEFKELGTELLEHIPARDLAAILFPPALAYEVLGGLMSGARPEGGDFELDLPEKEVTRAAVNLARWFSRRYFKTKIEGAKRMPAKGPVLMVGNHSAGLMPMDALFAIDALQRIHGADRIVHPLVHDIAYAAPSVARHARRLGILRASHDNARAAFEAGRAVLVYPGGDQEAFRPFTERHQIVLAGRKGFVKLALQAGVPIVPLVSVGLHESFIVLSRGDRVAEKLGLKKLLRTDVMPIGLGLPWGLFPAFFPFLPAPTHVDMRFLDPIELDGDPEDDAALAEGYDRVESAMQEAMDDLSRDRVPWLGRPEAEDQT
ncbi:MAG: acyltransferase family protein [Deltaproteobacteria bacterium]|nr:acyltransferase family protein [Deltaproteobacteria bacterium]